MSDSQPANQHSATGDAEPSARGTITVLIIVFVAFFATSVGLFVFAMTQPVPLLEEQTTPAQVQSPGGQPADGLAE